MQVGTGSRSLTSCMVAQMYFTLSDHVALFRKVLSFQAVWVQNYQNRFVFFKISKVPASDKVSAKIPSLNSLHVLQI